MGALPSQKYEQVLKSFQEFIYHNVTYFGTDQAVDEYWIKQFLQALDDGDWEI